MVLAIAVRSYYATDSASLISKADMLIEAVRKDEERRARGLKNLERNPFGEKWGLQVDGDLWEHAWKAVQSRGAQSQKLRKVKGTRLIHKSDSCKTVGIV